MMKLDINPLGKYKFLILKAALVEKAGYNIEHFERRGD